MANSTRRYVFFVGAQMAVYKDLEARLSRFETVAVYFEATGSCREVLDERPCHLLVVDLDGDAKDSLQLLADSEFPTVCIPKLALVDHGDIPTAVKAIRAGAVNCLEKPLADGQLLTEVQTLLRHTECHRPGYPPSLTRMETTVLRLVVKGRTTLEVARELHRSPRTIEVHRSHIMHKLDVTNPVELMKTAASMGLLDS